MAHVAKDRVKETTTTTGTGALTLAGAVTGFRAFSSVMTSPSDTCFYCIDGGTSGEWEVGIGTYSAANELTRTSVLASSNSNNAVSLSAGSKSVFITAPGDKFPATQSALLSADNISDTAYAASWNGVTTIAPSKDAVYDKFEALNHPGFKSANWYLLHECAGTTASPGAITANVIYYNVFIVWRSVTLSDLGARVVTNVASSLFKIAIFAHDPATGRPTGAPLADTGNLSGAATGTITGDISGADVTLTPGLYWCAIWSDSALAFTSITNTTLTEMVKLLGSATAANALGAGNGLTVLTSSETYGAWPTIASETFTEQVGLSRNHVIIGKAA